MRAGKQLLNRALNLGEDVVGVAADQAHRTDDDHQNHGQHDGVFRYVLTILFDPKLTKSVNHVSSPLGG